MPRPTEEDEGLGGYHTLKFINFLLDKTACVCCSPGGNEPGPHRSSLDIGKSTGSTEKKGWPWWPRPRCAGAISLSGIDNRTGQRGNDRRQATLWTRGKRETSGSCSF